MKKILVLTVVMLLVVAGAAMAGVTGTKHDLSAKVTYTNGTGYGYTTYTYGSYTTGGLGLGDGTTDGPIYGAGSASGIGNGEVCVHCHTPHGGSSVALAGVGVDNNGGNILWNRDIPADGSVTYYTTGGATQSGNTYNAGTSACMSCHDGALDTVLLNAPGSGGANVGAQYDSSAWYNKSLTSLVEGDNGGGTYKASSHPINVFQGAVDFKSGPEVDDLQVGYVGGAGSNGAGGKVECISCHEPHRTTYGPFLRSTNQASQICTTCHDK